MSLCIGNFLHANKWREVPITLDIVSQMSTIDEMSYTTLMEEYPIPWDEGASPI